MSRDWDQKKSSSLVVHYSILLDQNGKRCREWMTRVVHQLATGASRKDTEGMLVNASRNHSFGWKYWLTLVITVISVLSVGLASCFDQLLLPLALSELVHSSFASYSGPKKDRQSYILQSFEKKGELERQPLNSNEKKKWFNRSFFPIPCTNYLVVVVKK